MRLRSGQAPTTDACRSGQAILEYAILIGIVTSALLGIQLYAKRSIQAGIQMAADQVGSQTAGMAYEAGEQHNGAATQVGAVRARSTAARTRTSRAVDTERFADGGQRMHILNDTTHTGGALADCGGQPCAPQVSAYSEIVSDQPRQ